MVVGSARVGERRRGSRRSVGAQEQGDGALVAARCARLRPRARVACACCACHCCACPCCTTSCWARGVLVQHSSRSCALRSSTSSTSRGCAGPCFVLALCRLALCALALPMLVFYLLLETADGVSACTLNHGVVSFDISRMTDQAVRGARTASANVRVAVAAERLGGAWGVSSGSEAPRLGVQKSAAWAQKPTSLRDWSL